MRLSLEGFGEEFKIGKIAFELEDLKKDKEKRRGKIGDFPFGNRFRIWEVIYIYIYTRKRRRKQKRRRKLFLIEGGDSLIVWRKSTKELEKRAIATKAA